MFLLDYIFHSTDYTRIMPSLEGGMIHSQVMEPGTVFASMDIQRISLLSQQVMWPHGMPKLLGEGFMKYALAMGKLFPP